MKIAEQRFMNINQYIESMSEVRRGFLLTACVWFIFMIASGGRMPLTALLIDQSYFFALFILLMGSAMDAILIVELLRSGFPKTRVWSDFKHFGIMVIVWLVLILLSMRVLLLLTQPNLNKPSSALPESNRHTSIYFIAQPHNDHLSHSYYI